MSVVAPEKPHAAVSGAHRSGEGPNPASFPRYPKYKDSGVEWLYEVPVHWKVVRLRWLAQRFAGGTPSKDREDFWSDGTIPWLNSGAVNDPLITEPSAYITQEAFERSSAKWIPEGALVMALAGQGKTKGTVAQVNFRTTCNQSMAAIVPAIGVAPRFLFWWLQSNYQNIRNMGGGDLRDGLNLDLLGDIPCPICDGCEQAAIAAFLDRETAKIDALIAEQEKLITLLREKRQALISHAVTQGLDPNAPMKDSGIEWLGQVPAHWDVLPMRWHFECASGKALPADEVFEYQDDSHSVPVIGGNWVMGHTSRANVDAGVIVVGRVGALCGNVHFVGSSAWVTDNALIIKPASELFDLRYVSEALRARSLNDIASKTAQPLITGTQLLDQRLPCPPMLEQKVILDMLEGWNERSESLLTDAIGAIDLLKERRAALISAAVTGKIDVRGTVRAQTA